MAVFRFPLSYRNVEDLLAERGIYLSYETVRRWALKFGKPLIVRSAYRSPEPNRAVGGATRSKHLDGAAFDIAMANHDPVAFEAAAREVGFGF